MTLIEFINHVLIREIGYIQQGCGQSAHQNHQHMYLSFGLISQGIELLGSLTDKYNFDKKGKSGERFNKGLKKFFKDDYRDYADKENEYSLYKNLRCGLLHVVIPTKKLALGELKNDKNKCTHLGKYPSSDGAERLFLMAETFYEDFVEACNKAKTKITDGSIFTEFPDLDMNATKKEVIESKRDFLNTNLILSNS